MGYKNGDTISEEDLQKAKIYQITAGKVGLNSLDDIKHSHPEIYARLKA